MNSANSDSIDAIVTWVDGNEIKYSQKLHAERNCASSVALQNLPSGFSDARYVDNNEIEYCLNGIRKFMPWIRNIYLVTDNQVPKFLSEDVLNLLNIKIIDHSIIFRGYEWALPTFNSRSIETMLFRIPGLADRYIYLNDDFIPISTSSPADFFENGKVVVRGRWEGYKNFGKFKSVLAATIIRGLSLVSKRPFSAHLLAQMRAARLAGFLDTYIHTFHAPHAIQRKTLDDFFKFKESILRAQIRHKFRHLDQFVPHPLAHHLEAAKNNHVIHNTCDYLTIDFDKPTEAKLRLNSISKMEYKFVCIQSLEKAEESIRVELENFLNEKIFKDGEK